MQNSVQANPPIIFAVCLAYYAVLSKLRGDDELTESTNSSGCLARSIILSVVYGFTVPPLPSFDHLKANTPRTPRAALTRKRCYILIPNISDKLTAAPETIHAAEPS